MAVTITNLATGAMTGETILLPAGADPQRVRVVRAIRLANKGANNVKLNIRLMIGTEQWHILPADVALPSGHLLIEDQEITLGSGDSIVGSVTGSNPSVDFIISGIERPI